MRASEKYKKVFGSIESLADEVPWTTGLSNMVEWLQWETWAILGISKTRYWKRIAEWCIDPEFALLPDNEKIGAIEQRLKRLIEKTDQPERYSKVTDEICGPREALRRVKFFSENYLNKEFDIFLGLASDVYLDQLYSQFIPFSHGGRWSTHGNSGLFSCSVDVSEMQMDNLAYNKSATVLVSNELKLGGKKNKDQILKYSFLFKILSERGFVSNGTRFLLLFLGDKEDSFDLHDEIDNEFQHCRAKGRPKFLEKDVLDIAHNLLCKSYTWGQLIDFNEKYLDCLDSTSQVEQKLIAGFNQSLREKGFMQL